MTINVRSISVISLFLFALSANASEPGSGGSEPEGKSSPSLEDPYDLETVVVTAPPRDKEYQRGTGVGSAPAIAGGYANYGNNSEQFRVTVRATPEQPTDHQGDTCNVGNPIVPFTGNKIESELDFDTAGDMSLRLERTYNHQWVGRGLFGRHWLSSFDYSVAVGAYNSMWVQMPNGTRRKFQRDSSDVSVQRFREVGRASRADIVYRPNAGRPFLSHATLTEDTGEQIVFVGGRIKSRTNVHGVSWTFIYDGESNFTAWGGLSKVVHSSGRTVQFFWADGHVAKVIDPAGNEYHYSYDPQIFSVGNSTGSGLGRLKSVQAPGQPTTLISYHYEDPRFKGGLTGKSINGERYSYFSYDEAGRATKTEHAGGIDRHTFSYAVESVEVVESPPLPVPPLGYLSSEDINTCSWGAYGTRCRLSSTPERTQVKDAIKRLRTSITNPLGRTTVSVFEDGKLRETIGQATANCPTSYAAVTYDANGFRQMTSDAKGNITTYLHDAGGRLLKKVEAFGTPLARTWTYEWDTSLELIKSETLVGLVRVDYEYNSQRRYSRILRTNLSGVGVGDARVTTFFYENHANGLLSRVVKDGPLPGTADTIISTFDTAGNLVRVENALGHATVLDRYNGLGQPGRIKDANGTVVEYDYDARGRQIAVRRSGSSGMLETRYVYNSMGRILSVTTSDGVKTENSYDLAGRLVKTTTPESASVSVHRFYKYDLASNVTEIAVTRDTPPVPQVPTTVVIGSGFAVKWKAQPGVVRYVLQESKDGGAWTDVYSGNALEWTASGRPPGSYSYRIMACTADGTCSRAYLSEEPVVVKADLSPIINYLLNS